MDFDELISGTSDKWTDKRMQALFDALVLEIPYPDDIVEINRKAGISPGQLPLGAEATGRIIWRRSLNYSASQMKLPDVVAEAEAWSPTVTQRVAELRSEKPPLPASSIAAPAADAYSGFSANAKKERQIVAGDPTMLDVRFLELGVERAKAVCRIEAIFDGATSTGTGFRVGDRTILTNHHVVFDEEDANKPASAVQVSFNYQLGFDGQPLVPVTFNTISDGLRGGDSVDDWALVEVDAELPADLPKLPIGAPSKPVAVGDRVAIIQHPKGLHKKIALAHNLVRFVGDKHVQYWTDTDEGSSGAPVFNEKWEVVALHHASAEIGAADEYGFRNQGIAIEYVKSLIETTD